MTIAKLLGRHFKRLSTLYTLAICSIALSQTLPAHADISAREQWVLKQMQTKQQQSGSSWPKMLYEQQYRFYEQFPSGTRVYPIPGVVVRSGSAEVGQFLDCSYAIKNNRYVIYRGDTIMATYPLTADVTLDPKLGATYVEPGKVLPKRYERTAPIDIVP